MSTAEYCQEQDALCAALIDELRWKEWSCFHVAFIRIAAKQDWQRMMKMKLGLELSMSLRS